MAAACGVCNTSAGKYKCPNCVLKYCSVACFKIHKEVCKKEEKPTQSVPLESDPIQPQQGTKLDNNTTATTPHTPMPVTVPSVAPTGALNDRAESHPHRTVSVPSTYSDEALDGYRVPPELLAKISQDAQLVRTLQDPSLQQLIASIDGAHNPEECLKQTMLHNPELHNFVDNMLKSIGLRDEQSHSTIL